MHKEKNTDQIMNLSEIISKIPSDQSIEDGMEASVKIRYRDAGTTANLYNDPTGLRVSFYDQAKGVAPGQSAVFYEGDDVIGGGIIQRNHDILLQ